MVFFHTFCCVEVNVTRNLLNITFFLFFRASRRHTDWKKFEKQSCPVVGVSEAHAHRHSGRVDCGMGESHRLNIVEKTIY